MEENYICKFCGKQCKNAKSLRNHERFCKENPEHQESPWIKFNHERGAWNKGLTKDTDERIKKRSETFSKRYKGTEEGKRSFSHPQSEEHKQKMRKIAFERHWGGWHSSKSIEYDGINLDSTYEFEVAKELDENQVKWERPTYFLWEDSKGVKHRYYPDFYLPEYNVYLDPKNDYLINNKTKKFGITDVEKIEIVQQQNRIHIIILDKNNLTWQSIKEKIFYLKG